MAVWGSVDMNSVKSSVPINIWDDTLDAADATLKLEATTKNELKAIDYEVGKQVGVLNSEGTKSLLVIRRIVLGLEKRLDDVNRLIATNSDAHAMQAFRLLKSPLHLPTDPMTTLITSEQAPPIPAEQLKGVIDGLLNKVVIVKQQRVF